jgi:hypothetical protein
LCPPLITANLTDRCKLAGAAFFYPRIIFIKMMPVDERLRNAETAIHATFLLKNPS